MGDFELFDFSGIRDIAIRLIDAIEKACGWVVNHDTPKRIAKKTYMDYVQNADIDIDTKVALISNVNKITKEYRNQREVVRKATSYIKETAKPELVDTDWITLFMDKVRTVSDEEVQQIWAKLLADECNEPSSVPKRLLFILEWMSKDDAEAFLKLCSVSVRVDDYYTPVILQESYDKEEYKKFGIDFDSLMQLDKLGLVSSGISAINEFMLTPEDLNEETQSEIIYFERKYELPSHFKTIPVGMVLFSKAGEALCKAVKCEEQKEFWETIAHPWFERKSKEYVERKSNNEPR